MPQVARGAAVPRPVPEVEHGSCAFELHYSPAFLSNITPVDEQRVGVTACCALGVASACSSLQTVDVHAKAKLSSALQHQAKVEGGLRTAILAAFFFEVITSCHSRHRIGLDARPVLAIASASGPSAKDC